MSKKSGSFIFSKSLSKNGHDIWGINRLVQQIGESGRIDMFALTLIVLGGGPGGSIDPATQSLEKKKCPCLHINNTALVKQISLFDTALVMTNT